MSESTLDTTPRAKRLIGRYGGERHGPTVLCLGGIHGNEPAGVHALRRVFDWFEKRTPFIRGEIVGLAGNLGALERGTRFVDRDLNRIWSQEAIDQIVSGHGSGAAEDVEMRELHEIMREAVSRRQGPAYFIDLHTTSGRSAPFAVINDTLPNRAFARMFPVPIVLGLEEHVCGAIADYAHDLGCVTLGFEGGQHDDPKAVDLQEAAVWVALVGADALDEADVPDFAASRRLLADATQGLPRFVEILRRHALDGETDFEMLPGYENFQPVDLGQALAREHRLPVQARQTALLFMPLYQKMGDDGFFLARPVKDVWLRVSSIMRRMHLDVMLPWLPGVERHHDMRNAVRVDPEVARWYVNELFHLLGYRRRHAENGRLVFARRPHDVAPKRYKTL